MRLSFSIRLGDYAGTPDFSVYQNPHSRLVISFLHWRLIAASAAVKGHVDLYERRPLVFVPEAARKWMIQNVSGKEAEEIGGVC